MEVLIKGGKVSGLFLRKMPQVVLWRRRSMLRSDHFYCFKCLEILKQKV